MYLYYYNATTLHIALFFLLDGFPFYNESFFCYVFTLAHYSPFVLIFGCYLRICGCGVGVVGVLRYKLILNYGYGYGYGYTFFCMTFFAGFK